MKQLHKVLSEIPLVAFGGNFCLRKETATRDFERFPSMASVTTMLFRKLRKPHLAQRSRFAGLILIERKPPGSSTKDFVVAAPSMSERLTV